jgi:DNA (cytosine-5)-methyltransferase 1
MSNKMSIDTNINDINSIYKWVQYFDNLPNFKSKKNLNIATFFSGIGAVEQALQRLKVEHTIKIACDNDKYVKQSYLENYKIERDNWFDNIYDFIDRPNNFEDIDLLVGGSPCQSFSSVGKRKGLNDSRGNLIFSYIDTIEIIQPKVFIFENVKGLLTVDKGRTFSDVILPSFKATGYNIYYKVLNAKDYGIPQHRDRLFIVGFKSDYKYTFPNAVPLFLSVQDLLIDNADESLYLSDKGVKFVTSEKQQKMSSTQINGDIALCQRANQQFNWHGDFISEKFQPVESKYFLSDAVKNYVLASGTKGFYSKPKTDLSVARPLLSTMASMHRAGVDNYYTYGDRVRKLSPRECLRLMGFSDSFKQVVSNTQMYKQSGNSIVVDVLMHLISSLEIPLSR